MGDMAELAEEDAYLAYEYHLSQAQANLEALEHGRHTTADGRRIFIKRMEDEHLRNSIRLGLRKKYRDTTYWSRAVPKFKAELKRRGLKL